MTIRDVFIVANDGQQTPPRKMWQSITKREGLWVYIWIANPISERRGLQIRTSAIK